MLRQSVAQQNEKQCLRRRMRYSIFLHIGTLILLRIFRKRDMHVELNRANRLLTLASYFSLLYSARFTSFESYEKATIFKVLQMYKCS